MKTVNEKINSIRKLKKLMPGAWQKTHWAKKNYWILWDKEVNYAIWCCNGKFDLQKKFQRISSNKELPEAMSWYKKYFILENFR